MKLELNLKEEPFVFEVQNEAGLNLLLDASENIGGKNKGFRPMEALAASLAGCIAIDMVLIFRKRRWEVNDFKIKIDAVRKDEIPSAFKEIKLQVIVNDKEKIERIQKDAKLVKDKYCSVASSLNDSINILIEVKYES